MNSNSSLSKCVSVEDIIIGYQRLKDIVIKTPLQRDDRLSQKYNCNVYLKREDLQTVRSFKIRGALNLMKSLDRSELEQGVVCASAGNHAQGVAFSCALLNVNGTIFMPSTTPKQKVSQVELHGKGFVQIILIGDTFDDAYKHAVDFCNTNGGTFVHPFDDERIIAGQGTVALEILDQIDTKVDYIFASVGGGGLISGVGTYMKCISPQTKVIAVEPAGAPSLKESMEGNEIIELSKIDKFVDGAAVKKVGQLTYEVCKNVVDNIAIIPEGKVCSTLLRLYNENAIVVEPAGAMPVAALEGFAEEIQGKTVVCIVSGGNNDIERMQEIKERSMVYEGLQHYFIVNFPQRAGALREFLEDVLGPNDDINRFEYTKKNNKDNGPALVGIELTNKEDYHGLIERMKQKSFDYIEVNKDPQLFQLLI